MCDSLSTLPAKKLQEAAEAAADAITAALDAAAAESRPARRAAARARVLAQWDETPEEAETWAAHAAFAKQERAIRRQRRPVKSAKQRAAAEAFASMYDD
jgi:hypothetical protein